MAARNAILVYAVVEESVLEACVLKDFSQGGTFQRSRAFKSGAWQEVFRSLEVWDPRP